MSGDSARKASAPSTTSSTRKAPPPNLYTLGAADGRKQLNTGWEVWGSSSSNKRNASMSSLNIASDLQSNIADPWPTPRSASGTWDDRSMARPHQAAKFSAPRADTRIPGVQSATFPTNTPSFPVPSLGYDAPSQTTAESDLVRAMRGMAVEEGLSMRQPPFPPVVPVSPQLSTFRGTPLLPHGAYPPDYGYYSPARESFPDYNPYYASPDLNATAAYPPTGIQMPMTPYSPVLPQVQPTDPRQHVYYSPPPRPQFFYPQSPQMMHTMYAPPSPMLPPQMPSTPVTMTEKKLEMQNNLQLQLASRSMMYGAVAPLSPVGYPPPDYSGQMLSLYSPTLTAPGFGMLVRGNRRPMQMLSSKMLEEFRAARGKKWELKDLKGHVVEFSGDQHGSRFIQNELVTASEEERQNVFDEIVPDNTLHLIQDVFGNYVIQKLLEHGTAEQKEALMTAMEGHLVYLSANVYGCRVVQKAFECATIEQQAQLVQELQPNILKCVKDPNGNHVIQKLIECVKPEQLGVLAAFSGHVHELATHPFGCRVLQQCLRHLPDPLRRPLLDELLKGNTPALMLDQFGNYVVQFILEHLPKDRSAIISQICGRVLHMARHKFASNVVEKALIFGDSEGRRRMIEEIMAPAARADGPTPIALLMKDQYGNYVLQRALGAAEGEQKEAFINAIRPQLALMRKQATGYNKHLTSIQRELEKHTPKVDPAK